MLKDTIPTTSEEGALKGLDDVVWGEFNLKKLFCPSTRGRRLKSDDRISGSLPFVTARETDEGISDFISNNVVIFSNNTATIDMFGSAKYRNYKYGADDHIAVVHIEKLKKLASLFTTTAIHKASYTGAFNYSRNFYATDADALNISLPITPTGEPDYEFMEAFISGVQKRVVDGVVRYSQEKIEATKEVTET